MVVTDGFTGNVALKALEGSLRFLLQTMLALFDTDEVTRQASAVLLPYLGPVAAELDPENTGGAMLLGVDGVCVISHGSSSAVAVVNAIRVAHRSAAGGLVDQRGPRRGLGLNRDPDRPRARSESPRRGDEIDGSL